MCLSVCVYYYKWVQAFKVEMVSNKFTMDYNEVLFFFLSCDYNEVKGLKQWSFFIAATIGPISTDARLSIKIK